MCEGLDSLVGSGVRELLVVLDAGMDVTGAGGLSCSSFVVDSSFCGVKGDFLVLGWRITVWWGCSVWKRAVLSM